MINRIDYLDIFPKNDLDTMIIPQQVVINHIFNHIHKKSFISAHAINASNTLIIELEVTKQNIQVPLSKLPQGASLCTIYRDGVHIAPYETSLALTGDILILLVNGSILIPNLESLFT